MILKLEKVSKHYDDLCAVKELTIRIDEKDFIVIKGSSGSGKSTLLKILGGLLYPDEGKVLWKGENLRRMKEDELSVWRRDHVGYVFQEFQLIDYLTAKENVELPMIYCGKGRSEAGARAKELLKLMRIDRWSDHYPHELSGGQAQRVAIARSLANMPEMILCDEPTGALDPQSAYEVMEALKMMNQYGKTIVLVTHDEKLERYGNRIWRMSEGVVDEL